MIMIVDRWWIDGVEVKESNDDDDDDEDDEDDADDDDYNPTICRLSPSEFVLSSTSKLPIQFHSFLFYFSQIFFFGFASDPNQIRR